MRRYLVTDEHGVDLGECRVYLVDAPGKCPRMVVVLPDEPEARCYRMHREDAPKGLWEIRVKREEVVGTLRLRPTPQMVAQARPRFGYAQGM